MQVPPLGMLRKHALSLFEEGFCLQRPDDYSARRQHLAHVSDQELKDRFWALAAQVVDPLIELSRTHTTPSIERSVLLRMGFSSLDAGAIVQKVEGAGLLGKGAGHVVLRLARHLGKPYSDAGRELAAGEHEDVLSRLFDRKGGLLQ